VDVNGDSLRRERLVAVTDGQADGEVLVGCLAHSGGVAAGDPAQSIQLASQPL